MEEDLTFEEQIEDILETIPDGNQKDFIKAMLDEHWNFFDSDAVYFADNMADSDINAETMYFLWKLTGFFPDTGLYEDMNKAPSMNGLDFALMGEVKDKKMLDVLGAREKKILATLSFFENKKFDDPEYVIDFGNILDVLSELNTKLR